MRIESITTSAMTFIRMEATGSRRSLFVTGYEFNYGLKAMQVQAHTGSLEAEHSFVSVAQDNVVLTAVKKTESGDGQISRFYEWAGIAGSVTLTVPPRATGATLVNLMEKAESEPIAVSGNKLTIPVTPFEIRTVRVNYKTDSPDVDGTVNDSTRAAQVEPAPLSCIRSYAPFTSALKRVGVGLHLF
jgi:hypothetical protein